MVTDVETLRQEVNDYVAQADMQSLQRIREVIESTNDTEADWWDAISEQHKASILRGMEQADKGLGISHEEMQKRYPQWFRK